MSAAMVALLVPAGAAEAASKRKKKVKQPVVTSIQPMQAEVGDTLTIRGRNFRPGKGKNTVVFKRDGYKAIFVKADVATRRQIRVKVPQSLLEYMGNVGAVKVPTVFRVRILAARFGRSFTGLSKSPKIGPDKPPPPPLPPSAAKADGDCDGDQILNKDEVDDDADGLNDDVELSLQLDPCVVDTDKDGLEDTWEFDCDRDRKLNRDENDDDNDLLSDSLEGTLMTDPCRVDSDGDHVEDGFEHKSAIDLNDDEYQQPNESLPYPGKRPYPNPLNQDAHVDYDGDGLKQREEYDLWKYTYEVNKTTTRPATAEAFVDYKLSYSDGLQYSVYERCPSASSPQLCDSNDGGRRVPTLRAATYTKWFGTGTGNVCAGSPCEELGFLTWASQRGYRNVELSGGYFYDHTRRATFDLLDANLDGQVSDHFPVDNPETPEIEERYGAPRTPVCEHDQFFVGEGDFALEVGPAPCGSPVPPNRVEYHRSLEYGSETPVLELFAFDQDPDGFVSDDERDEDADGLSNFDEVRSRMQPEYWDRCYQKETQYPVKFAGTSHVDADSDNDGVRDGADDQDHDDLPNVMELSRIAASNLDDTNGNVGMIERDIGEEAPPILFYAYNGPGFAPCTPDEDLPAPPETWHADVYGQVHPFNPCLPDTGSRSCGRNFQFDELPAPFDEKSPRWYSLQ